MDLKEKRAIVTGGANGIGRRLVELLAERGVARVGVLDRDETALTALASEQACVRPYPCDLTDATAAAAAVEAFAGEARGLDLLVNNAGAILNRPLLRLGPGGVVSHEVADWDRAIAVNLSAAFYVTRAAAALMARKRTRGVIVNVSSICAAGNAGQSAYSAAKAGIDALTVTWAKELGGWNIRVAGVAPGFTDTEAVRASMDETLLEGIAKQTPLRRLGRTDDIAEAILAVVANDFIHGRVIAVDGGLRL